MQRPSWKIRRRLVFGTLAFCAWAIVYLLLWGEDTKLNETIALGVIGCAISTLGSYVFGAVWDDRNVMSTLGKDAYREPAYHDPTFGLQQHQPHYQEGMI